MGSSPLSDKDRFPTEEVLAPILGGSIGLWKEFHSMLEEEFPEIGKEWRYYNDGKSWLMKVTRKKKTVLWLSVVEGSFRTTFYVSGKAADRVEALKIPEALKDQYRENDKTTKGITIRYAKKKDVDHARELIRLKLSLPS